MKIHIVYDDKAEEPEVTVICREMTDEISRLLRAAGSREDRLTAVKDGQTFILKYPEIIYIDTGLRLYELEEMLPAADFFRANKSCIVGIRHIRSIRADIDGRLLLTMDTSDKLWVSRQYAADFRKKIGM